MTLKSKFKTDVVAARDGVWFDYPMNSDGTTPRFKLARASKHNKKYVTAIRKVANALNMADGTVDLHSVDDTAAEKLLLDVFVDTVLLGWENFQPEDDGVVLPYSRDNALSVFGSDEWIDLFDDLDAKSKKATGYQTKVLEAAAKN